MDYTYHIKRNFFGWILLTVVIACIYMGCGLKSKGEIIVEDCLHHYHYYLSDTTGIEPPEKIPENQPHHIVNIKNTSSEDVIIFVVLNKKENTTEKYKLFPGEIVNIEECTQNSDYEIVGAVK
jgi:hypothetical protein